MAKKDGKGIWVTLGLMAAGLVLFAVMSMREGPPDDGESGRDTRRTGEGTDGDGEADGQAPPPAGGTNLLSNPGFEEGSASWEWYSWSKGWAPFEISSTVAHGGEKSLRLPVSSAGETRKTIVWGGVQKFPFQTFPECIDGWYMVADWQRGAAKQYLQAVIITDAKTARGSDQQIRMVLTGIDRPSYNLTNAHYFFADPLRPTEPPVGRWEHFELPVRQWFTQAWGSLPDPGTNLRVLFEARFDDRPAGGAIEVEADVYYDDLYVGPKADGHCM